MYLNPIQSIKGFYYKLPTYGTSERSTTMKRTTPRTPNPSRKLYKQYAETQMTLEEILTTFSDYTIYSVLDNTSIYIVSEGKVALLFEHIGYEDEECIPDIYEAEATDLGKDFDFIAYYYLDDCIKINKLN